MIKVTAEFVLQPGSYDKVIEIADELIQLTRREDGCISYELAKSDEDENVLMMFETWRDQDALDAHSSSAHFTSLVPKIASLCVSAPVVKSFFQII